MSINEQEYQGAIPKYCSLQTVDEHMECLLLCWGITHGRVQEGGEDYCKPCDLYKAT